MRFRNLFKTLGEIFKLPLITVKIDHSIEGTRLYKNFTRPHPKYFFFKQKTIGVAIIKLNDFINSDDFLKSINGKNSAAYFSRKALREGYSFRNINPKEWESAILEINNSAENRQGRAMDDSYKKSLTYPLNENNIYFGVFIEDILVAYLWVVKSGELALLNRLLGHAEHLNHGIMYLMIVSFVENELKSKSDTNYVMYDTFLGAGDGLKMFKSRCGFNPYRIKWEQC